MDRRTLLAGMAASGATVLAVGFILPVCYLIYSLFYGEKAGDNPWGATGLEWQTPSPPPLVNFDVSPIVTSGPYAYDAVESERIYEKAEAISREVKYRVASDEADRTVERTENV